MRRILFALLFALCLPAAGSSARAQEPRTLHERLGPTPEAAVQTFLSAWQKQDYPTAYLMFSTAAAERWQKALMQLNFRPLLPPGSQEMIVDVGRQTRGSLREAFAYSDWVFDRIMMEAGARHLLPFTLGTAFSLTPQTGNGSDRASFSVETNGQPAKLFVTAVKTSFGPWKVEQVVFDGSDPAAVPWGFR
jgi:hypothetical protein